MSRKKTNKVKFELETEGGEIAQVPNNKKKPFKIERGGVAKPLGNGFYYLQGKSHENGGIDMTFNTDARIFSSVPFLNGKSPAERIMRGENPDTTFVWQERFKDVNGINDDGTKKAKYGKDSAIKTETDKEVSKLNRAVYSSFDPTEPYPTIKEGIVRGAIAYAKSLTNPDKMLYEVTDSVADNMWRYRMGMSVNPNHFGEIFDDGSVSLPKSRENEIPIDTTFLKNRIAANEKLAKKYPLHLRNGMVNEKREIIDWALAVDKDALNKLRHTYKTGEPVVINEGAYNSRSLIDGGELQYPRYMPLNMLKDYTIQYVPTENSMKYRDTYNFDNGDMNFEPFVPGTPYKINGSIDLTKNNMKSNNKKKLGGSTGLIRVQANGKDRLMYVPFTGEKTKANRKKAEFGDEVIITAPNKKREETLDDYFPKISNSISYPDSLSIVSPYIRTPYSIRTKTSADLERDMKVQMIGREFSNDTTGNYIDRVRFNNAYLPYEGEMATVIPSTSVVPDSIENPIERINRSWQSEYKPVVNNTVKKVNGVVNTSWVPKRSNISINVPKINAYDPRIAMIGRTFSDNITTNNSTVNGKVSIPRFNTPSLNTKASDLPETIALNPNLQKAIDRMNQVEGSIVHAGLRDYTVPEITKKQERQQIRKALKEKGLDWWSRNKKYAAPAISALGNIGAGVASYLINKKMLNDLDYAPTPVAKRAAKLKTNININPELTALSENLSRTIEATNANTASSRVANARNQASMLNTTLTANKLYTDKENRETTLINQDRLNQQEVANANVDAYNTWRTGKTNFENTIREQQSENAVSLVDNINKGIQTGITDAEKRRQFRNNLAIMAAAYPNVTPELLRTYGADFLRMGGKVKLNKKK